MEFTDLEIKGMKFKNVYLDTSEDIFDTDAIVFVKEDGELYVLSHEQDCCEKVWVESIDGDLEDLIDSPLIMAEEAYEHIDEDDDDEWLRQEFYFYKFATVKGYVTIRFNGESNGYYSTQVDLRRYLVCENNQVAEIHDLFIKNMTFKNVYTDSANKIRKHDSLIFTLDENNIMLLATRMNVESCFIENITGDLNDLIGAPLIRAEEVSRYHGDGRGHILFRFETIHGLVTVTYSTDKGEDYIVLRHFRRNSENGTVEEVKEYY